MKIGIFSDRRHDSVFSPNWGYLPKEAVLYDVELPSQVREGLEIISDYIPSGIGKFPLANQVIQGHNNDYGLIFRIGESKSLDLLPEESNTSFTHNNLVARISFGMEESFDTIQDSSIVLKEPAFLTRLHLNVYGARNFLSTEKEKQDMESFNYTSEVVHFSLRWVNGKFDNSWNEPRKWLNEKDSKYLNKARFEPMRTTYFETNISGSHLNGNFYHDLSGIIPYEIKNKINQGRKVFSMNDVENIIGPRKPNLLPSNLTFEDFIKEFPESTSIEDIKNASGYHLENKESFPSIGYSKVCSFLHTYGMIGQRNANWIPDMTMDEGVEYIFGRVLPAVKKFISV